MANNDRKFKLCYVRNNILYFTDNFKNQWGDDWNDSPFDCNAGEPYEYDENENADWNRGHGHLRYIAIKPDWIKVVGRFGEPHNVPYSVQEINAGVISWVWEEKAGGLFGGATMAEAKKWCKNAHVKWAELKE